jgi:hypothetical protein
MTDETNPDVEPEDSTSHTGEEPATSDDTGTDADTDPDTEAEAEADADAEASPGASGEYEKPWGKEPYMTWRNRSVVGELIVHYPERDITFPCDGDAALRAMRRFAQPDTRHLEDTLDELSNALHIWLAFDRVRPLAMTWLPGVPGSTKAVIDPDPRQLVA